MSAIDGFRRHPVLTSAGLAVVVMLPAIVAGVAILRPQWFPTGDMAQAELHVRGFWSHPPLVGAAGRIQDSAGVQGSHPGPALWVAMWPIYAIGGSTSAALVVSVVTVHLVTAALAFWLAMRRGGLEFAVALAVALVLVVHAGGPDQFTEPWNPWMGLLPFLVLLLAAWSILDDERWAWVLAVVAGSYSIQAHTGYALVVAGLVVFLLVVVLARADRRRALPWIGAAALAGVVVWLPPLIDQLRREPGNVSILIDNFASPTSPYLALSEVAEITVVQFGLFGPWALGPARDLDVLAVVGAVAFAGLWLAGVVAARRRAATSELHLHAVLAVAAVLAVVSVSRIFGAYLEYTVRWIWLIVATVVAASVVSLWRSVTVRPRRWAAIGAVAGAAVLIVVGAVQFADRAGPTGAADSRIVGELVDAAAPALDPATPYLVRWFDPATLGASGIGLVLELERLGYHTGVDRQFAAAALPHRVLPEESAGGVLYVVVGESAIERARTTSGLTELAYVDVRTDAERERSEEIRAELEEALTAAGMADRIDLLDSANGQAQLLFADPPMPPEVAEPLGAYVALRHPTALFEAAPLTPMPVLD